MQKSSLLMQQLFGFLTRRVCFSFAVCFFSVLGALSAIPAMIFMWATIPYETEAILMKDIVLCLILVGAAALMHYLFYGLGRLWGRRWELASLRVLNDTLTDANIPSDIPTPTLKDISYQLERLPIANVKMAGMLSSPVVIIGALQELIYPGDWLTVMYVFRGAAIAWITYLLFTFLITEFVTVDMRRQARKMLADRNAWEGTRIAASLKFKFGFIIILMFNSILITYGIATSQVIKSTTEAIIIFSALNLVIGGSMCTLVFISMLNTLREIQMTATSLSDEQQAHFISGSIDREFINMAMGLYHAALKIIGYRDDLVALNLSLEKKVEERTEEIRHLSLTDPLTGCFNRRYLAERLPQEIKKAVRYKKPLSLIISDLDHFKMVNDAYGHQAGDLVLKEFARLISELYRTNIDWVSRYGGEEFVIVLPETGAEGARVLAERLRLTLSERTITHDGRQIHITSSFGISGFDPDTPEDRISADDIIRAADRCLYQAKEEGRNRVVVSRV